MSAMPHGQLMPQGRSVGFQGSAFVRDLKTLPDFESAFAPWPEAVKCPVRLIGIRGALEPIAGQNAFERYDDLIAVMIKGSAPRSWRASTDPSRALVRHPINANGAAQLLPGCWWMEKHFLHGDPLKKCLGQSRDVVVARLDGSGQRTGVEHGQFGICIHSGGAGIDTGRFSAGCQIVANNDGYFGQPSWGNFILPIRQAMDRFGLREVPYLLIEEGGYGEPSPGI
jgi:hypothetical protein